VLGTSGNDGTPPDFAWVGLNTAGDRATAYEASFPLAEGSYKLVAHVDVEDNGAQTSGTIKLNDGIDLVISCPRDKGDLPDDIGGSPDYPTLNASSGPSHIIGDLYLGNCVDAETNGQPNVAAVGDDANLGGASVQKGYIAPSSCSLGADDEDGVQPVLPWSNGANGGKVSVTTSGSGYFCGWLDFGAAGGGMPDGTFDSVISTAVTGTGPHVISFTVPDGTFAGSGSNVMVYMRFRLFTEEPAGGCTTNSGYTGEAKNGEVEDYKFAFSPTAVSLQAVAASVNDSWQMPIVFTALALFGITILLYLRRRPV
jgi:hypothetical protein